MAFDGRLIQTRAGIAAAAARRWEQAERHYHAALQLAEALSSRIEQADLRRLYARMLLDRDQPATVNALSPCSPRPQTPTVTSACHGMRR